MSSEHIANWAVGGPAYHVVPELARHTPDRSEDKDLIANYLFNIADTCRQVGELDLALYAGAYQFAN